MMTTEQKLASLDASIQNAYKALETLSKGAQSSVSFENRNYDYESRGELLGFIKSLEAQRAELAGQKPKPFMSWENFS